MSKRVLAMALAILAFFFFVGSPFQQSAKAVAVVDDAVIAILIAALAAVGITFVTTGAYGSLQEYVESLFIEFAQYQGTSTQNLLNGCQSGTNKFGQLLLNNRFVLLISTFGEWLKSKFELADNSTTVVQAPGASLDNMQMYGLPLIIERRNTSVQTREYTILIANAPIYALIGTDSDTLYVNLLSNEAGTVRRYNLRSDGTLTSPLDFVLEFDQSYGLYYDRNSLQLSYFKVDPYIAYNQADIYTALEGNGAIDINNIGIDIVTGNVLLPLDDDNYTDGDGAVIDTGSDWGTSYGDVIDGIEDGFSDSQSLDPTITYEGEEEVNDQVQDTQAETVSQNVGDYQSPGLQNVFPFCIPFDIYAFFECLAADPEAPNFVWRFYLPGICDEEIEIDLAAFDSAARILRTMELLLFIVGLAFVTRDKFLRG